MTRFLAILAALTCAASAQTYRTVTADTNNVIRTNFTLGAAQVSGSFAISNVTGLQSALDGKLATNGSAAGLTNFPALLLATNSSESVFPSALLRTNGDGSGLTNLPNANLSNATGVLGLANGGTGQTNAALAIEALLPAYTNNEGKVLGLDTNLALVWTTNAGGGGSGSVTSVDASGGSTGLTFSGGPITNTGTLTLGGTLGLAYGGTGSTNASGARTALELGTAATNDATAFQPASTNLDTLANNNGGALTNVSVDLTAVLPAYSNNAAKVLAVASGETNVEWIAVSNTVTDASTLTNFPASILQTNSALTDFPAGLLRTNGSAAGLTSFPTLNQNTTGTASNVTGVVAIANGGSGQTTAAAAIEAFLPAYSGNANRILALNSNANGLVWTTNAGGGGLPETPLAISNGGTEATTAAQALANLTILQSNNTVQIGESSDTKGASNVVAIGALAKLDFNNDHGSTVIGYNTESRNTNSIAIGINAAVHTANSVQIGQGTNSANSNRVQFFNWGSIDQGDWGYLTGVSSKGGYRMTNTGGVTTNISVIGTNNTNTLVFTNGLLMDVTSP